MFITEVIVYSMQYNAVQFNTTANYNLNNKYILIN